MRRGVTVNVRCATCGVGSFFEYASLKEMRASSSHHAPWYCVRCAKPDRVLTPDRLRVEWTSEPSRAEAYGKFWGSSGVFIDEGYYAAAKDFPVGSVVKVTCEVILPASEATT